MLKKHDVIEIDIEKVEFPNKGIGFYNGERVIVKGGLPNERWLGRITKFKNGAHLKPLELLRKSGIEIEPECEKFGICGGCTYQHLDYSDEVQLKKNMILELFNQAEIEFKEFCEIKGAINSKYYRNKMEYTFGDEGIGSQLCLGMRKKQSYYEVVNVSDCLIVNSDFGKILNASLEYFRKKGYEFYHRINLTGGLRNLVIRKGFFTNEILVNLVTADMKINQKEYTEVLLNLELEGKIVGIIQTINNSSADAVKPEGIVLLYGQAYFNEKLLGLDFKISPFSFFQTNSAGAEELYSTVKEFVGDTSDKTVFDLYCGTGTIAQIVSKGAKKVVGIELVEEAIESARINAELNKIDNCEFIAGDVLNIVDELKDFPDIIILDPPRDGINIKAIRKIIEFKSKKIVYISCKPSSLVEDLKVFSEAGYICDKVQCHDMFPRTGHIETVVLLNKTL